MIAQDWTKSRCAREKAMMIDRARTARIIITCAYCVMGLACFFIIVLPGFGVSMRLTTNVTDPGRPLPLQTHYVYDVTRRPQYELTFTSQAIYIVFAIMSYSGIDNFLGLLVFHICGQLDILKARLARLDRCADFRRTLRSCVAKHIRLLRLGNRRDRARSLASSRLGNHGWMEPLHSILAVAREGREGERDRVKFVGGT